MVQPELAIFVLNLIIVLVAYYSVYPKLAGGNFNKISVCDLFASGLSVFIVGSKYWGSGVTFSFLGMSLNWFWYTVIVYAAIEVPIAIRYFKKYQVDTRFKKED